MLLKKFFLVTSSPRPLQGLVTLTHKIIYEGNKSETWLSFTKEKKSEYNTEEEEEEEREREGGGGGGGFYFDSDPLDKKGRWEEKGEGVVQGDGGILQARLIPTTIWAP